MEPKHFNQYRILTTSFIRLRFRFVLGWYWVRTLASTWTLLT